MQFPMCEILVEEAHVVMKLNRSRASAEWKWAKKSGNCLPLHHAHQ